MTPAPMTKDEIILANKEFLFPAVFHFYQGAAGGGARQGPIRLGRRRQPVPGFLRRHRHRERGPLQRARSTPKSTANSTRCSTSPRYSPMSRRPRWRRRSPRSLPAAQLTKSFFTNSGTEANETAILAARCYTGNTEIVALRHSYHGRSAMAMTLTGQGAWRLGPSQAGIVHAHNAYCYRCPFGLDLSELRSEVRAGHGRTDPHHHHGPHRRLHRRADPGRRRLHHAAQGILPDRREDRAQLRRHLHQRRSADRLGPHRRQVVRHRAVGRGRRTSSPAPKAWATARPSA